MFHIFAILAFMSLSSAIKAQGNLQFNRAINYNLTCTTPGTSTQVQQTVSVTVPAGKVWKIESCNLSYAPSSAPTSYSAPGTSNYVGTILIDQAVVSLGVLGGTGQNAPIWLAAGTHTFILAGYANTSAVYIFYGLITGIEFNITQ